MRKPKLQIARLAHVLQQGFGVVDVQVAVILRCVVLQLLQQNRDIAFFEDHFTHRNKGRVRCFRVLDKVLPAVCIIFLKQHGRHFFGHVARHPAKAQAGDKRDHVVFKREEVINWHWLIVADISRLRERKAMLYFASKLMIFSKDYVGYLARQTVKHLVAEKMVSTDKLAVLNERVTTAMTDELSLEDRINDEVRVILEAFQDDMRKSGASYPEMFKKVKTELARKYKAVL